MRSSSLLSIFVLLCLTGTLAPARAERPATHVLPALTWVETARDVYWDEQLRPELRILRSTELDWYLLAAEEWTTLPLWHPTEEGIELGLVPTEALHFDTGRLGAHSDAGLLLRRLEGSEDMTKKDAVAFAHQGVKIRIARHEGALGELSIEELFEVVPSWHTRMELATPEGAAVARLGAVSEKVLLELALGSWCGDSREHVPRLLRALEDAGNPKLQLAIVALPRGFRDISNYARLHGISRVPTVIVRREGQEIGRFVESPVGSSIEADLAAILTQAPREPRP